MAYSAADISDQILQCLKLSNLNYKISENPFSVEIKIKKKFVWEHSAPQEAFHKDVQSKVTKIKLEESTQFKIPTAPDNISLSRLPSIFPINPFNKPSYSPNQFSRDISNQSSRDPTNQPSYSSNQSSRDIPNQTSRDTTNQSSRAIPIQSTRDPTKQHMNSFNQSTRDISIQSSRDPTIQPRYSSNQYSRDITKQPKNYFNQSSRDIPKQSSRFR